MCMEYLPAMMITLDLPVLIAKVYFSTGFANGSKGQPNKKNSLLSSAGPMTIAVMLIEIHPDGDQWANWRVARQQHQELARRFRAGAPVH